MAAPAITAFNKDDKCPRCATSRYTRQGMRLRSTPCGHEFCDNCERKLFAGKPSVDCPTCKKTVYQKDLVDKKFDDGSVHTDVLVRHKELQCFNKTLADFDGDQRKYNDYLEMVEDLAYNLANGEDLVNTRAQIEKYKQANKMLIEHNVQQRQRSNAAAKQALENEAARREQRTKAAETKRLTDKQRKGEEKERLILRIGTASSGAEAQRAVQEHQRRRHNVHAGFAHPADVQDDAVAAAPMDFSSASMFGTAYKYTRVTRVNQGPAVPNTPALLQRYPAATVTTSGDRSTVGLGYTPKMAVKRALEEAFEGLFIARQRR
eukprot:m.163538 g.163538  ORF g.163538 m.163538 type:complete len:320 (-) comp17692_c0_seq2:301-1260(-)